MSNESKRKSDRTKLIKGWLFGWCGNGATHAYSKPYNFEKFPKDVPKRSTKGGHREKQSIELGQFVSLNTEKKTSLVSFDSTAHTSITINVTR